MSLLLHVCCAPCLIYPASVLKLNGQHFSCYFHNPNIHPYKEYKRRLDTFLEYVKTYGYGYQCDKEYDLNSFLRMIVFREKNKCRWCYLSRLKRTAEVVRQHSEYDSFSTTLLYSRYQNHDLIVQQARYVSSLVKIPFDYRDYRNGWQQGIDESKRLGLYRQSYCGCIFSEQERYDNRLKKRLRKERNNHV